MSTFTITCAATTARLDAGRKAQVTFTATNTLNQPLKGRARVVPADRAKPDWFSIDGDVERQFAAAGTQQYTVQIKVPEAAPAGRYTFRLKMVGVPNPDELFGDGPAVSFEIPKPVPRAAPIPWLWIAIAAAIVLVLAGGGFGAYTLLSGGKPNGSLDATGLTFADQDLKTTSAPRRVTLTNAGTGDLRLQATTIAGTAEFQLTQNTCSSATLKPKATCTVSVVFAPTSSAGGKTATLTFANSANEQLAVALAGTAIFIPDKCKEGFVWRLAGPSDHVCVLPVTAQQVIADNSLAASRRSPYGGLYGPDTCLLGYVWRDAFLDDHVCVTGATRDQAAYDNSQAQARKFYQ